MSGCSKRLLLAWALLASVAGCSPPIPEPSTAPPAPPQPVVQTPPAPARAPEPDPYEPIMTEVSGIVKRCITLYSEVRDKKTADKAIAEIEQMKTRLGELTIEVSKLVPGPIPAKHAVAFQNELAQLQTAVLNSPDIQRVLSEPESQLELIGAYQSFAVELIPLGQAIASRQHALPLPQPTENQAKP